MDHVAAGAQVVGEAADGVGEPERVVEDDDLGHGPKSTSRRYSTGSQASFRA
jgi:hypothetical protein